MSIHKWLWSFLGIGALTALITIGYVTRDQWVDQLFPKRESTGGHHHGHGHSHGGDSHGGHGHSHGANPDRIELSPQAQKTLNLSVKAIQRQPYWQTIEIPAQIVERPGRSDHGITSTLPGIVREIFAVPGEVVKPGQKLFTIRVISEHLQTSQRELYQTIREKAITQKEKDRLQKLVGAIPQVKLLDLDYQFERLNAKEMSYRFELKARGLTEEQVQNIVDGNFIQEITITVPDHEHLGSPSDEEIRYEIEQLEVHRGDQVDSGEKLCILSQHRALYVVGRVFDQEVHRVEKAMRNNWTVQLQMPEKEEDSWPTLPSQLQILYLGNKVDPESQTIPVYVPLTNQYRQRTEEGRQYRSWRFRPSQRAFLRIPVAEMKNVFVVPTTAVVREGAEHYVFQQNGNAFDRKEVQILYRDRNNVVIESDDLFDGLTYLAHRGAAQLQRALQIQSSSGNIDPHAGHMH